MQNPPVDKTLAQINAILAESAGETQRTVAALQAAVPRVHEAIDAIEGLQPANAKSITRMLAGQAPLGDLAATFTQGRESKSQPFQSIARDPDTGRLTADVPKQLIDNLGNLVAELKRQPKTSPIGKTPTVAQEVKGLTWQQRQTRLVESGDLLPIEEVQRRLLTKRDPTVRQIIVESEKEQQQRQDRTQAIAQQTQPPETPTSLAVKPSVRPSVLRQREEAEVAQRDVPVKQRIAGMTWQQRRDRLRESDRLLTAEQVQERETLEKKPTKRQIIQSSEAAEEERRQQLVKLPTAKVLKPPIRPVMAQVVPEGEGKTATQKGVIASIRTFFKDRQAESAQLAELQTPIAEKVKDLSVEERFERLKSSSTLLSEEEVRKRRMLPAEAKVTPGMRIAESEGREERQRKGKLEKLQGGAEGMGKAGGLIGKVLPRVGAVLGKAGPIGMAATAAVGVTVGLITATWNASKALAGFASEVAEANKSLARFHPVFANMTAVLNRQKVLLDFQRAQRTSGTAAMQARAVMQMNRDLQPMRESFQTIKNVAGTVAARAAAPLALGALAGAGSAILGPLGAWLPTILPRWAKWLEDEVGKDTVPERRPMATVFRNIANDEIRRRRRPAAADDRIGGGRD